MHAYECVCVGKALNVCLCASLLSLKGNLWTHRYSTVCTHTHKHAHGRPDATWAVSGELEDTLILKLLMAVINHMILNHFTDGVGGGREGGGNKMGNMIEERGEGK